MFVVGRPTIDDLARVLSEQGSERVTYAEVGATQGRLPEGYRHDRHAVELGVGDGVYRRSVQGLVDWEPHRRAGLLLHPERSSGCQQGAVGRVVLVAAVVVVLAIATAACDRGGSDRVERVATGGTGQLSSSAPPPAEAGTGATTTEAPTTSMTTGVASTSTTTGVASTSSTVKARPAVTTTTLLPTTSTAPAVTTTTGPGSEQGPALPVVKTLGNYKSADHAGDPHYLPLFIAAQDDDGWIRQFVVDWGDGGSLTTYDYNPFPCKAMPPSGWPAGNYVSLPSDTTHPLVAIDGTPAPSTEHYYPNPDSYIVTVTVRSTACDGSHRQEGSGTTTWSFN